MNSTHKKRLRKLAQALIDGTHGLAMFNYSITLEQSACGTIGCAMGACPSVFPKSFRGHASTVVLKGSTEVGAEACRKFFGLSEDESLGLFFGDEYGPLRLVSNMECYSAKQVGRRILRFLEWKEKQ